MIAKFDRRLGLIIDRREILPLRNLLFGYWGATSCLGLSPPVLFFACSATKEVQSFNIEIKVNFGWCAAFAWLV